MATTIEEPTVASPMEAAKPTTEETKTISNLTSSWMKNLGRLDTPEPAKPEPVPEPKPEPAPAPAKPAETPKPETVPPVETGEDKWPRTAQDWKAYKKAAREREEMATKERDDFRSKYELSQKEIENLRKAGPPTDVEPLKKQLADYQERLTTLAVERDPRFESYFKQKTEAQYDIAKGIVGPEKTPRLLELMAMADSPFKDSQLDELVSDLTPVKQSRIGAVLNALSNIDYERKSEIEKARTRYDSMMHEQKQQREQSFAKQKETNEKLFQSVLEKHQGKEGTFLYQMKDGDAEWNAGVQKRVEQAKNLMFGNVPHEAVMEAALYSTITPDILKHAIALQGELAKRDDIIKKLTAATPSLEGGKADKQDAGNEPLKKNATPMEAFQAFRKKLTAEM